VKGLRRPSHGCHVGLLRMYENCDAEVNVLSSTASPTMRQSSNHALIICVVRISFSFLFQVLPNSFGAEMGITSVKVIQACAQHTPGLNTVMWLSR